ncbi:hypothetical protein TSUD_116170 [Trifolium subterraneum]|uniref:F-box domain-containing protein n=1 Tax=Trifolium subterraneum TaxID=3900 RepID=A0A2Z6M431_TRISU|nr:hypothetical protein TSUD_116170 [Trifolium subterraneum]
MASGSDVDDNDPNHKRQRFTTTGTLKSPPSLQAPPLPTLSLDLIEEILCRLPVKLLLQFRCLNKSFKSLISDSKFAKKHLRLSTKRHHLMVSSTNNSDELVLFDSPIASDFPTSTLPLTQISYPNCFKTGYWTSCSCDGIFCLTMRDHSSAILWNPSLRTFKILPPLDNKPLLSAYSFGYDKFIHNYKVIAMSFFTEKCEVSVLTLGMDSWRRIQDFPSSGLVRGLGIFVAGTVNWLPLDNLIVSLDLKKELYQKIPQPPLVDLKKGIWTLGALKDCLCIYGSSDDIVFLDIWITKEYRNKASWTKLYCVPHMGIGGICAYTKTMYFFENDRLLVGFYELGSSKFKVVVYDSKNGTFMSPKNQNFNSWTHTEVYIESLISPCS